MVSEVRKQSKAWMETDYSKHTYFRWNVKWRMEHLGALGTMGKIFRKYNGGKLDGGKVANGHQNYNSFHYLTFIHSPETLPVFLNQRPV